jgi:hypothetical protein
MRVAATGQQRTVPRAGKPPLQTAKADAASRASLQGQPFRGEAHARMSKKATPFSRTARNTSEIASISEISCPDDRARTPEEWSFGQPQSVATLPRNPRYLGDCKRSDVYDPYKQLFLR